MSKCNLGDAGYPWIWTYFGSQWHLDHEQRYYPSIYGSDWLWWWLWKGRLGHLAWLHCWQQLVRLFSTWFLESIWPLIAIHNQDCRLRKVDYMHDIHHKNYEAINNQIPLFDHIWVNKQVSYIINSISWDYKESSSDLWSVIQAVWQLVSLE